ncbi:MAG: branched-chain amino acid ABC transporter permease, partial [Acholeplasmataceae bacterium]
MKSLKQILNTINTYVKKFFAIMKKPLSMVIFVVSIFIILLILIESNAFSRYFTTLIILILVMIVMSTSLNIATGFLGQLHLGHAAFMGIGAYTASLIALALEDSITNPLLLFILSTIVAMIVAGIASLLVGTPALRLRGDYLGIMTLGFGEIVKTMITNLKDITNGAQGLYGIPRIMDFPIAYWTTVLVVLVIYL